jgi:non-specific serine/threonine protein kinase
VAADVLGGGVEMMLTEMEDKELLRFVALDLSAAVKEADG